MMKLSICLAAVLFTLSSCEKTDKTPLGKDDDTDTALPDPIANPINSVSVKNYPEAQIKINNQNKSITIEFDSPAALPNLTLEFGLDGKVSIIEPPAFFNLTEDYPLKIKNNGHEQAYTIRATAQNGDFSGWVESSSFGSLPEHIKLYQNTNMQGKPGVAYIAVVDLSKDFQFNVLGEASGLKTPSQFYDGLPTDKKPAILINAGYFSGTSGVSLLVRNSQTLKTNTVYTDRGGQRYYITRSAIGKEKNKPLEINWVFTPSTAVPTYAYPVVSPNVEGQAPLQKPSFLFPERAKDWRIETACGGGPIAAKYGKPLSLSAMEHEFLTASGSVNRSRSAVGLTSDNKLIVYVNQGEGFDGVYGYTWEDVGKELVKLGCYDAMHFDGGGSSCMLINGTPVIKCGDSNGIVQRAVASAVMIN